MTIPPSDNEIFQKLTGILCEALRVPAAAVTPEARIFDDLGAESIDILDIRFRIEEAFGFRIREGEIIKSIDPELTPEQLRDRFTVGVVTAFIHHRLEEPV